MAPQAWTAHGHLCVLLVYLSGGHTCSQPGSGAAPVTSGQVLQPSAVWVMRTTIHHIIMCCANPTLRGLYLTLVVLGLLSECWFHTITNSVWTAWQLLRLLPALGQTSLIVQHLQILTKTTTTTLDTSTAFWYPVHIFVHISVSYRHILQTLYYTLQDITK